MSNAGAVCMHCRGEIHLALVPGHTVLYKGGSRGLAGSKQQGRITPVTTGE